MYHLEAPQHHSNTAEPRQSLRDIPEPVFARLSPASQSNQWIFFTAQCPRPTYGECLHHAVDVDKVMQLKNSCRYSELEVVTRALQSGNASAIVCSGHFSQVEKNCLIHLAQDAHCQLVFLSDISSYSVIGETVH